MAVANGSAELHQQHSSSARAALAVCAAAVVLVGYFVVSSSITVLRPNLCGQFVSDTPGQAWTASPPRGVDATNPFLRVGFVERDAAAGPVLHSFTGADLPLQRPGAVPCRG